MIRIKQITIVIYRELIIVISSDLECLVTRQIMIQLLLRDRKL